MILLYWRKQPGRKAGRYRMLKAERDRYAEKIDDQKEKRLS